MQLIVVCITNVLHKTDISLCYCKRGDKMKFKKISICFLIIVFVFLLAGCGGDAKISKDVTEISSSVEYEEKLYRTNIGECYHYGWCDHLRSKIATSVYEINEKNLRPCSKCKPPYIE